jgi:hypothetical protein
MLYGGLHVSLTTVSRYRLSTSRYVPLPLPLPLFLSTSPSVFVSVTSSPSVPLSVSVPVSSSTSLFLSTYSLSPLLLICHSCQITPYPSLPFPTLPVSLLLSSPLFSPSYSTALHLNNSPSLLLSSSSSSSSRCSLLQLSAPQLVSGFLQSVQEVRQLTDGIDDGPAFLGRRYCCLDVHV